VCGLNPHAGEGGLLGSEERDFINPTLAIFAQRISRTSSASQRHALRAGVAGEFDVVVAFITTKASAPLKVIDSTRPVNVTLGLPHVRTSPDHGTAFGIAGQGVARVTSFANA